jgi:hypothetical protein
MESGGANKKPRRQLTRTETETAYGVVKIAPSIATL